MEENSREERMRDKKNCKKLRCRDVREKTKGGKEWRKEIKVTRKDGRSERLR